MIHHNNIEDPNLAGDFAEYYAVTWLWDNGYQVFRNCSCTGPIDLIAIDEDGHVVYIDVKTSRASSSKPENYNKTQMLTDTQKEIGVQILAFDPRDRSCTFIRHRHETTYNRHRDEYQPQLDLGGGDSGC